MSLKDEQTTVATTVATTGDAEDDEVGVVEVPRTGVTRRRVIRWAGVSVGLVAVGGWAVVAGSGLQQDPTGAPSPLIGKAVPSFSLPNLDGSGTVASADYAGRVLVVNFWASWCVPCREEARELERFSRVRVGDGVSLVGIVVNDTEDAARGFRDEFGLSYALVMDPGGRAAIDFGLFGVPETFVVNADGVVMARMIGAVDAATLDQVVAQVRAGESVDDSNDKYWPGTG